MILRTLCLINRKSHGAISQTSIIPIKNNKCSFFNFNKNQNNDSEELKGHGRKNQTKQSNLTPLDSIMFPFPFEWTLQANNFKYYDPRFTEQPIKKNLEQAEK